MDHQEWMENASAEQDAALAALDEKLRALDGLRKQKKKALLRPLITTVAFALVTIALFSAQTFAYFSDTLAARNQKITSGNLDVELIEMMADGGSVVVYTDPVNVYPSDVVSKIVTVKNVGVLEAYVRIRLEKTVAPSDGLPANWQDLMLCGINWADWEYADGYYYYKKAVESGAETAALFETVSFSPSMGNEFMGRTMQLKVIVEATQVGGNGSGPMNAVWR